VTFVTRNTTADKPRRLFAALRFCLLLLLCLLPLAAEARMVTDSAGRKVEVPDRIQRVFASGPPATILLYVLKPEALLGWSRPIGPVERSYIAPPYRDLPVTGRLTGRGGDANLEIVLKMAPDMILDFGSIGGTYASLADRVQSQTGIPYILIDGRFENTAAALRLLGSMLGVPKRGEALARYVDETFASLDKALAAIPEDKRPRVYLARGPDGLQTGLKGSINTEIIERAGGRNVFDTNDRRKGLVETSIEQVLAYNPDTIITWDDHFYRNVWKNPEWQSVAALQKKRVYLSPAAPFGWIDRPPSINRLIGLRWLAELFCPKQFPEDLRAVTRDFYNRFYHEDLNDRELDRLIQWADGKAPR